MRNAPAMTGLRVLEAVVRTGSLSAAARELCVTPPAISHRLRGLEAQSGAALVQRLGGRFVATELGKHVLDALGDAFARILAADALLSGHKSETLRLVSSYSFAVLWLTPRLARFQARHPEVRLFLEPSHSPLDHGASDITILHAAEPPEKKRLDQTLCRSMCGHRAGQSPGVCARRRCDDFSFQEQTGAYLAWERPRWGRIQLASLGHGAGVGRKGSRRRADRDGRASGRRSGAFRRSPGARQRVQRIAFPHGGQIARNPRK